MENKMHEFVPYNGSPALTFRYIYNYGFDDIAAAFVKKYNLEPKY
jgi:hypothetical protein